MFNFLETIQDGKCHRCDLAFTGLTFVWHNGEGRSWCPECEYPIWTEDEPAMLDDDQISEYERRHML